MTLRAILTESAPVGNARRFHVGVAGEAPSGKHVYRPQYLRNGPWCKTTARIHAARLQRELEPELARGITGVEQTTMLTTAAVFLERTSLLVDVLVDAVLAEKPRTLTPAQLTWFHGLL